MKDCFMAACVLLPMRLGRKRVDGDQSLSDLHGLHGNAFVLEYG